MKHAERHDAYQELREALRDLCGHYDAQYWQRVDEARGYPEEFVLTAWRVIVGPPGLPVDLVEAANRMFNRAFADPQVRERFHALGLEVGGGSASDVAAIVEYLRTLPPARAGVARLGPRVVEEEADALSERGATVYGEQCADCHVPNRAE